MRPILFDHIPEVGLSRVENLSQNFLSELLAEPDRELSFRATAPAQISFRIERRNRNALIFGQGLFQLSHHCIRCLKMLPIVYNLDFELELENPNLISLDDILREELFLELPTYPTCEPSCSG